MNKQQQDWLEQFLGLSISFPPEAREPSGMDGGDPEELALLDRSGSDTGGGGKTSPSLDGAQPRLQSTVSITNRSGHDLQLVKSSLQFPTAKFVPAPPSVIPAHKPATFKVIESTVGADKTDGSLQYHVNEKRHNTNITFIWSSNAKDLASMKIEGDGPYSQKTSATKDSEAGNEYIYFVLEQDDPDDDKLQVRVDVENESGFDMTLVSATVADPEHTEFWDTGKEKIPDKISSVIFVQALDEDHQEAAGTLVYRIEQPNNPHTAQLNWTRSGRPFGIINPNDGTFIVITDSKNDRFNFVVRRHDGPPPPPPGPTKVTIINNTGFPMKQDLLMLDGEKAQFKSKPSETLDAGRKTQFEVELTDPLFPRTDGFSAYSFHATGKSDPTEGEIENIVNMTWRLEAPSLATIVPEAEGVTVEISGSNTDVVFTVTGPALDFEPPEKINQPTLRLRDKSKDGWVEYLQEALNHHMNAGLVVDGDFGQNTLKAVIAFQTKHKPEGVLVDGIVGNQTWSFLREGVPEKPATDGRKPHSYVEKGQEARWVREQEICRYDAGRDALVMQAISVGDIDQIKDRLVRVRVTNPAKVQKIMDRPLGPPVTQSTTGEGSTHDVAVEQFSTLFDENAKSGPPPGAYTVDAYFDHELGGDKFSEVVVIPSR